MSICVCLCECKVEYQLELDEIVGGWCGGGQRADGQGRVQGRTRFNPGNAQFGANKFQFHSRYGPVSVQVRSSSVRVRSSFSPGSVQFCPGNVQCQSRFSPCASQSETFLLTNMPDAYLARPHRLRCPVDYVIVSSSTELLTLAPQPYDQK